MLVPELNGHVYYNGGHVPNVSWMGKKVSQLPVIESENLCENIDCHKLTMMIAWVN